MKEKLRKIFEAEPGKSTIELKEKCSDCGCEVIIEITRTSDGFGLEGGALFKGASNAYLAECPECYNISSKTKDKKPKAKRLKPISKRSLRLTPSPANSEAPLKPNAADPKDSGFLRKSEVT